MSNQPQTQQKFYQVLDVISEYDEALTEMDSSFSNAMVSLAYIKFINPYSSISISGYKPTPAILQYDSEESKLVFGKDIKFRETGEEDQEELQKQDEIEKQVEKLMREKDLDESQKVLTRFGAISQGHQARQASVNFRKCLQNIIVLAQKKRQANKILNKIENESEKLQQAHKGQANKQQLNETQPIVVQD